MFSLRVENRLLERILYVNQQIKKLSLHKIPLKKLPNIASRHRLRMANNPHNSFLMKYEIFVKLFLHLCT